MDVDPGAQAPSYPSARHARLTGMQVLLVVAFVAVGAWYLAWRPATFNPAAPVFSRVIFGAELFGFVCALLYVYMCWRLQRRVAPPVPDGTTAAVFVPTINESVDLVRRTLMAAQRMAHVGGVWLLDDGDRAEMRALAAELGCRYLARTENSHAKAGNLNHALAHCDAEYVAIFDADHAPAATFLQDTLGFFSEPRVAFVQTPQDFYNLDSFQHRVKRGRSVVWSEQTLFFRVIQAGKDRLNSAFFCGSCAVIRRAALDDIGGFATGTVTEDIHTSLKLHKRGWRSVYYGKPLAFGIAPSYALPFLKQRLRWGQGAMQVWREEGVLFAKGLTLPQRLSYLATMLAYFEGWQRAVFFLAPVVVLFTGVMPILTLDGEFLLHFLPYYALTFLVFEEIARGCGRTLLTEQYNMMRFAVFITATFGMFLRRLKFVVTPKRMGEAAATRRTLWPQYAVLVLNAVAIPCGIALHGTNGDLPTVALLVNVGWALATLSIAWIAIRYALSTASHRRREYRFPLPVAVRARLPGGDAVALATDISPSGVRLVGSALAALQPGDLLRGELLLPGQRVPFEAKVRARLPARRREPADAHALGCELQWASAADRNALELFLFGSDLQWQLNGLRERVPTPTERLAALLRSARVRPPVRLTRRGWAPLVVPAADAGGERTVGFIAYPDGREAGRTIVATHALSDGALQAAELTPAGPRAVVGRLERKEVVETLSTPLYLYRLSA